MPGLICAADLATLLGAIEPTSPKHHYELRDAGHLLIRAEDGRALFWPIARDPAPSSSAMSKAVFLVEGVDAGGYGCFECGSTADDGYLLRFSTRSGAEVHEDGGLFCSKNCHDWWHGLRPRFK
jgi:hypothetical protein